MTTQTVAAATVVPQWSLGDRLRKVRTMAGLDQRTFAQRLEVPAGSLAAWETDRVRPRDVVAIARRIELLTGVPASWTLGVHDNGPRPTESDEGREGVRRLGLEPRTHWFCGDFATVTPIRRVVERRSPGERELAPAAVAA